MAPETANQIDVASDSFPLHDAVKDGDIEKVKRILEDDTVDKNLEDNDGVTALIEASIAGNEEIAKILIEAGCPAQPPLPYRHTPLRGAAVAGQDRLIRILLAAGADPNAKSEGDRTPLMGACFLRKTVDTSKSVLCVKALLVDPRTDPTPANSYGETALDLAKIRGYSDSIELVEEAIKKWNS